MSLKFQRRRNKLSKTASFITLAICLLELFGINKMNYSNGQRTIQTINQLIFEGKVFMKLLVLNQEKSHYEQRGFGPQSFFTEIVNLNKVE